MVGSTHKGETLTASGKEGGSGERFVPKREPNCGLHRDGKASLAKLLP